MARKRKASPKGGSHASKKPRSAGKSTQQSTGRRNESASAVSERRSTRRNPGDYVKDSLPYGGRESLVLRDRAVHARQNTPDRTPSPEVQTDSIQQHKSAQQGPVEPKKSPQDSAHPDPRPNRAPVQTDPVQPVQPVEPILPSGSIQPARPFYSSWRVVPTLPVTVEPPQTDPVQLTPAQQDSTQQLDLTLPDLVDADQMELDQTETERIETEPVQPRDVVHPNRVAPDPTQQLDSAQPTQLGEPGHPEQPVEHVQPSRPVLIESRAVKAITKQPARTEPFIQYAHLYQDILGRALYVGTADGKPRPDLDSKWVTSSLVYNVKSQLYRVRRAWKMWMDGDDLFLEQDAERQSEWEEEENLLERSEQVWMHNGNDPNPYVVKLLKFDDNLEAYPYSVWFQRVSYWKYENGGRLDHLLDAVDKRGGGKRTIPLSLLARLTHQLLTTLNHFYKSAEVYHHGIGKSSLFVRVREKGGARVPFVSGDFEEPEPEDEEDSDVDEEEDEDEEEDGTDEEVEEQASQKEVEGNPKEETRPAAEVKMPDTSDPLPEAQTHADIFENRHTRPQEHDETFFEKKRETMFDFVLGGLQEVVDAMDRHEPPDWLAGENFDDFPYQYELTHIQGVVDMIVTLARRNYDARNNPDTMRDNIIDKSLAQDGLGKVLRQIEGLHDWCYTQFNRAYKTECRWDRPPLDMDFIIRNARRAERYYLANEDESAVEYRQWIRTMALSNLELPPLLYDTARECLNAKDIPGPWHLAKVRVTPGVLGHHETYEILEPDIDASLTMTDPRPRPPHPIYGWEDRDNDTEQSNDVEESSEEPFRVIWPIERYEGDDNDDDPPLPRGWKMSMGRYVHEEYRIVQCHRPKPLDSLPALWNIPLQDGWWTRVARDGTLRYIHESRWEDEARRPEEVDTKRLDDWRTEWRHTPETDVLPAYAHMPTRHMQFCKPRTNDGPLPAGWREQESEYTTTYLNVRTGRSQETRPPFEDLLPAGWWRLEGGSFEGSMLYLHRESHTYQRTRPTEEYLAQGWKKKTDSLGAVAYYHADGSAQSQRPTEIALPPDWWRRICSNGSIAYTHPPSRTEQRTFPMPDYLPDGWKRQGDLFVHQDGTTQSYQPTWDPLPDGWWMRLTDNGLRLYVNRKNRIVQYTRPTGEYRPKEEALPPGWWIRIATDGVRTYVHYETRTEQHIDKRPSFSDVSAEEPTLPPGWWKVVNVKGAVGYIHPVAKATSDTWPGTG